MKKILALVLAVSMVMTMCLSFGTVFAAADVTADVVYLVKDAVVTEVAGSNNVVASISVPESYTEDIYGFSLCAEITCAEGFRSVEDVVVPEGMTVRSTVEEDADGNIHVLVMAYSATKLDLTESREIAAIGFKNVNKDTTISVDICADEAAECTILTAADAVTTKSLDLAANTLTVTKKATGGNTSYGVISSGKTGSGSTSDDTPDVVVPGTDEPGTDVPGTDVPGTDVPVVDDLYTDLPADHWARPYVDDLYDKGIVNGDTIVDGKRVVRPDSDITRQEAAVVIVKALGLPVNEAVVDLAAYTDGSYIADWAVAYVAAATEAGVLIGYDDGSFGPTKNMTREEAATMLMRAFEYGEGTAELTFADAADITWSKGFVAKAVEMGVVKGYTDNTFLPAKNVTRAEMFTMISKCLAMAPVEETPVDETADAEVAEATDAEATDAEATDAEAADAEATDAEATDAEAADAEATDAEATDAEAADAEATDAEATDAETTDAESAE